MLHVKEKPKPTVKEVDRERRKQYQGQGKYGVLNPKDYEPKELIKKTYAPKDANLYHRSLFAHTDWLTPPEAIQLLDYLPASYNRFSRGDIKQMLEIVCDTYISLGRESSVVIYFWTEQPEIIGDLLKSFNPPDEFSITERQDSWVWDIPESKYYSLVRAWWE